MATSHTKAAKESYNDMKRTAISLSLLAATLLSAAQTDVRRMTLAECIQTAMENNLGLKVAEKQVEQRRALEGTAWDLAKTELSLAQDPTSGGSPDNALSLQQSIDFPTVYVARRRQLKAETQAERSRKKVEENRLKADVVAAFAQLAFQAERKRILQDNDSVLARYADVAEQRYKAGESRQLELLTAQRMQRENRQEMIAAESCLNSVQTQLKQLLNVDYAVLPAEAQLTPLPFCEGKLAYGETAEAQYDADRLQALKHAVTVAKGGYAPTISLQVSNQLVISSWNPYNQDRSRFSGGNFMGFEVGIGVPLFFGATKARVKAANREREAAELQISQRRQEMQRDYDTAMAKCREAKSRMDFYNGTETIAAEEMRRLAQLEYEHGEIGYVEYVAALQSVLDTRMKRAQAINDFNQSVAELSRTHPNT